MAMLRLSSKASPATKGFLWAGLKCCGANIANMNRFGGSRSIRIRRLRFAAPRLWRTRMLSSKHLILRMTIACSSLPPNASGSGSLEHKPDHLISLVTRPGRCPDFLLKASAPLCVLGAGPMHRAFRRLYQFVFFNVIAAPVAFQKKVEFPMVARLPACEGEVIYILHRVCT